MDEISSTFLKDGVEVWTKPICDTINLSIKLSIFPDKCKIAELLPLFKTWLKLDPKNCRPISLLHLLSKLIEKAIHTQAQEYLDKRSLLHKFQSGLRKKIWTDSCLVQLSDYTIIGMDKGILIDLQKTFDTLDHDVLLKKMECMGFKMPVIKWFKSYLSNRKFFVLLEGVSSEEVLITCGIPQGSILGPLLFLVYINDLPQALSETP